MQAHSISKNSFLSLHKESIKLRQVDFALFNSYFSLLKQSYENNKAYNILKYIDPLLVDDTKKNSGDSFLNTVKKVVFFIRRSFFRFFYDVEALSEICISYKKKLEQYVQSYSDQQLKKYDFNEKIKLSHHLTNQSKDVLFVKKDSGDFSWISSIQLINVKKNDNKSSSKPFSDQNIQKSLEASEPIYRMIKKCTNHEFFSQFFVHSFLPKIVSINQNENDLATYIKIDLEKASKRHYHSGEIQFSLHFQKQIKFKYISDCQTFLFDHNGISVKIPVMGSYELSSAKFCEDKIILKARKFGINIGEISLSFSQFMGIFSS